MVRWDLFVHGSYSLFIPASGSCRIVTASGARVLRVPKGSCSPSPDVRRRYLHTACSDIGPLTELSTETNATDLNHRPHP